MDIRTFVRDPQEPSPLDSFQTTLLLFAKLGGRGNSPRRLSYVIFTENVKTNINLDETPIGGKLIATVLMTAY